MRFRVAKNMGIKVLRLAEASIFTGFSQKVRNARKVSGRLKMFRETSSDYLF